MEVPATQVANLSEHRDIRARNTVLLDQVKRLAVSVDKVNFLSSNLRKDSNLKVSKDSRLKVNMEVQLQRKGNTHLQLRLKDNGELQCNKDNTQPATGSVKLQLHPSFPLLDSINMVCPCLNKAGKDNHLLLHLLLQLGLAGMVTRLRKVLRREGM